MSDSRSKFGLIDLVGRQFGRLTVLRAAETAPNGQAAWICRCECGVEKRISGDSLRRGATVSCGCLGRERRSEAHTKHGAARRNEATPEYVIWRGMIDRCSNPNNAAFSHYGQRGITVCERWRDFSAFLSDMGARPSSKHTLERENNNLGYSPDNCSWATMRKQARNKRTNVPVIRDDGVRFNTMVEAAESVGVHPTGIRAVCEGTQRTAGGHRWSYALLCALQSRAT